MTDPTIPEGAKPVTPGEITPHDMPVPTVPAPKTAQGEEAPGGPHSPASAGSTPAPAPSGEIDRKGVLFDPAKHNHLVHPLTGCWMPKGGRKVGTHTRIAATADTAAPPDRSYVTPEEPPAATPPAAEAAPSPPANGLVDTSHDAGEVGARAVQFGAGLILRAPDECTAAPAEHNHMSEAIAAWVRTKGWQGTATIALMLMLAAWLLKVLQKPRPRATIEGWFGLDHSSGAKNVTPESERSDGAAGPPPAGQTIEIPASIPPLAPR